MPGRETRGRIHGSNSAWWHGVLAVLLLFGSVDWLAGRPGAAAAGPVALNQAGESRALAGAGSAAPPALPPANGGSVSGAARAPLSGPWTSLGDGVFGGGTVQAVLVVGTDIYVGGEFAEAGGVLARNVARYSTTSNTWSSLGTGATNGVNGAVRALALVGTDVYAGGFFNSAGGTPASYIARWSTVSNTWSSLGSGTNFAVYALAALGTDLYVGGDFTLAGGAAANSVARWATAGNTWASLGTGGANGVGGIVFALASDGTRVFVGGNFTTAGGSPANRVAAWTPGTSTWSSLGTGGANGLDSPVYALTVAGPTLFVGGQFTQAGGAAANRAAQWSIGGGTWSSLGAGGANGLNDTVVALSVLGGSLFVGGQFTLAGGAAANRVAEWSIGGGTWSSLGAGGANGVGATVYALGGVGTTVLVGGAFTAAGGNPANHAALWSTAGSSWSTAGAGATNGALAGGRINALLTVGSDVYVGGSFTLAGTTAAANVARFTPGTGAWAALGAGVDGPVFALALVGTDVYVGGTFPNAGGATANSLARWSTTGSTWSAISTGIQDFGGSAPGTVNAFALLGTDLYIGGQFYVAGGNSGFGFQGLTRLNTGTLTFSSVSSTGMNGVFALALVGTDLFAGGNFTAVNGVSNVRRIARFATATSTWSTLGTGATNGVDGPVYALGVVGTDLYVGGRLSLAGGVPSNSLARWSTSSSTWSGVGTTPGSLVASEIYALVPVGTDLWVGGSFRSDLTGGANRLAVYATTTGAWTGTGSGTDHSVRALTPLGADMFLGGSFGVAGDLFANGVARRALAGGAEPAPLVPQSGHRVAATNGSDISNTSCSQVTPCRNPGTATVFGLPGETILVGPGSFGQPNGNVPFVIAGSGVDVTRISPGGGAFTSRVFALGADVAMLLRDMTLRDGTGGVDNAGALTLDNVLVTNNVINNSSTGSGGGLINQSTGVMTIRNSTVYSNTVTGGSNSRGGGISNEVQGRLTISNTNVLSNTMTNNASFGDAVGGGIYNGGIMTATNSVISNNITRISNTANDGGARGGGIMHDPRTVISTVNGNSTTYTNSTRLLVVTNTVISNNLALAPGPVVNDNDYAYAAGGGIYCEVGQVQIQSSQVISNTVSAPQGAAAGAGVLFTVSFLTETLGIQNSTIAGNRTWGGAGGGLGGGVLVTQGTATVDNSIFSRNVVTTTNATAPAGTNFARTGSGGGFYVFNQGQVIMSNSTISQNQVGSSVTFGAGGGIENQQATFTLTASSVLSNTVTSASGGGSGAGLQNQKYGLLMVRNSTVAGNSGGALASGSALFNRFESLGADATGRTGAAAAVDQSGRRRVAMTADAGVSATASDSQAGRAAVALPSNSTVTFENSTIANNSTGNSSSGAIHQDSGSSGPAATTTLSATLLLNNPAAGGSKNCFGTVQARGYTLSGDASCNFGAAPSTGTGNADNATVTLGPVADNGGPTLTLALLSGPAAIGVIPPGGAFCPATDQRGSPRPGAAGKLGCDVGAFESAVTGSGPPVVTPTAVAGTTPAGNLAFVRPLRVIDTRPTDAPAGIQTIGFDQNGNAVAARRFNAGETRRFKVGGTTFPGGSLPAGITGVLANVTIVQGAASGGFVTVFPGNVARPNASTTNPSTGIDFNFWASGVASDGTINVYSTNQLDVLFDVVGYFSLANPSLGNLRLLSPFRVVDTRPTDAPSGVQTIGFNADGTTITAGTLTPSASRRFSLAGRTFPGGSLPADASAVLLNVTIVQPGGSSGGFVTVYPADGNPRPNASTVNPSTSIAFNGWAASLPASGAGQGQLEVYSTNALHLIVDVVGYLAPSAPAGGSLSLVNSPNRVLDTRPTDAAAGIQTIGFAPDGSSVAARPFNAGETRRFRLSGQTFAGFTYPASVRGVLASVTIVQPGGPSGGFVTIFPGSVADNQRPNASTVNPSTGADSNFFASGLALAQETNPGTLGVYSTNQLDVLIDVLAILN